MASLFRRLTAIAFLSLAFTTAKAQAVPATATQQQKPYKVLTSGRQITIKSARSIQQVMLWTAAGNRVVEQKELNNNSFVLNIPVSQKTFFLMIGLNDGKVYTEKLAIP